MERMNGYIISAFSLSAGGELSGVPRGQRGRPLRPQPDGARPAQGLPRHAVTPLEYIRVRESIQTRASLF